MPKTNKQQSPQQSQVHEATADASSAPTGAGDQETTRNFPGEKGYESHPIEPAPVSKNTVILRDETDSGGPLVIKTDDPDLNPPHIHSTETATLATPEPEAI